MTIIKKLAKNFDPLLFMVLLNLVMAVFAFAEGVIHYAK